MPERYSPSRLGLLAARCPGALEHVRSGVPEIKDETWVGTSAHVILEALANEARKVGRQLTDGEAKACADDAAQGLLTDGRRFSSVLEPPPGPQEVLEGRDLALDWNIAHPLQPDTYAELRGAFDREWRVVPWDSPDARFRLVFDYCYDVDATDEEGGGGLVFVARDYKTGWQADASLLDGLQMRSQAVAALLVAEGKARADGREHEHAGIRLEVANLRTGRIHGRTIWPWLNDDDRREILKWRDDLTLVMDADEALAAKGPRPFRVCYGCLGCPFALSCPAANAYATTLDGLDSLGPNDLAERFIAVSAVHDALRKLTKEAFYNNSPLLADGSFVGFQAKRQREAIAEAPSLLLDEWLLKGGLDAGADEIPAGAVRGLLKVMNPGSGTLSAVAKAMFPGREGKADRENFVDATTELVTVSRFGIHKSAGESAGEEND